MVEKQVDQDTEVSDEQKKLTSQDYYIDSYSHFGIHEEMLKDTVRTSSYRDSIINNRHLFQDKIVLDVGCGTGILSMFAAKAGAKKVFAVDFSSIAKDAKQIVKDNGLESVVEVIHGKMEDIELPVEKVDIIISEWMGYFLLYESMLDTVLFARDKWLNPKGGKLLPDKVSMFVVGIEDEEYKQEKIEFWNNVYGFDMSCMKKLALLEPLVETVEAKQICTSTGFLVDFEIAKMENKEVDFEAEYEIRFLENDYCHALVVFFDVEFNEGHKAIHFSTGPEAQYTHWKQTIFYLPQVVIGCKGEKLTGKISCARNEGNKRDLDINLSYCLKGERGTFEGDAFYRLR